MHAAQESSLRRQPRHADEATVRRGGVASSQRAGAHAGPCATCGGTRTIEVRTGYRITGSGFGDAEEVFEPQACPECGETPDEEHSHA